MKHLSCSQSQRENHLTDKVMEETELPEESSKSTSAPENKQLPLTVCIHNKDLGYLCLEGF